MTSAIANEWKKRRKKNSIKPKHKNINAKWNIIAHNKVQWLHIENEKWDNPNKYIRYKKQIGEKTENKNHKHNNYIIWLRLPYVILGISVHIHYVCQCCCIWLIIFVYLVIIIAVELSILKKWTEWNDRKRGKRRVIKRQKQERKEERMDRFIAVTCFLSFVAIICSIQSLVLPHFSILCSTHTNFLKYTEFCSFLCYKQFYVRNIHIQICTNTF